MNITTDLVRVRVYDIYKDGKIFSTVKWAEMDNLYGKGFDHLKRIYPEKDGYSFVVKRNELIIVAKEEA